MPAPKGPQWGPPPKATGKYTFVPAQPPQGREHDWRADNRMRENAAREVTDRQNQERQEREERAEQARQTAEEPAGHQYSLWQVTALVRELRPDLPEVLAESFAAEAMQVDDSPTIAELHPDARWAAIRAETAQAEEDRKAEAHTEANRLRAEFPLPVEHYAVQDGKYHSTDADQGAVADR